MTGRIAGGEVFPPAMFRSGAQEIPRRRAVSNGRSALEDILARRVADDRIALFGRAHRRRGDRLG